MKIIAWSGIVAALLTGCSSSADLGGFSSSVDGQRQIQDLTATERTTLCGEIGSFMVRSGTVDDMAELTCRANASVGIHTPGDTSQTDAQVRASCQENYDLCKASSSPTPGECMFPTTNCTATVAELSACLNELAHWAATAVASTPMCSAITVASLEAGGTVPEAPWTTGACGVLGQKCASPPITTGDADGTP